MSQIKCPTRYAVYILLLAYFTACKKAIEMPPPDNQLVNTAVFANDATATAAITGIYSEMMNNSNSFMAGAATLYAGMSADELLYYNGVSRDPFMKNELTEASHTTLSSLFWDKAYKYIYVANLSLKSLQAAKSLTPAVKNRLMGEALFIRAFCYLYLVNLFGDVPLVTSVDHVVNAGMPRTPANEIYNQLVADLLEAQQLLPAAYPTAERTRPNKWAATALLARIYLYRQDYPNAEIQATAVIASGMYTLLPNLPAVFLKNSNEAIWQLQPVNPTWNTWEGREILPATAGSAPTYIIHPSLLAAFETGDQRKTAWVASRTYAAQTFYYPYKYRVYGNGAPITEYYMVIRLAECFLIRAEARLQQDNITAGQADLDMIRSRAGLPNTTAIGKAALLAAIAKERRIELFAEWGHRWFDLKRTGTANAVLGTLKPATWQPTDMLWPIPISQINANPSLTQNPGY